MSLLDGLSDAMINPIFDAVTEADLDDSMDFEMALEAVIDIELSEADIDAILDDENPDNIVSDMTSKDETVAKIKKDVKDEILEDDSDDGIATLEAMLDELNAMESDIPEDDDPADDPESKALDACNQKACEMDDDDTEYDEGYEDSDDDLGDSDDDDDYVSLDSLLGSIFNN